TSLMMILGPMMMIGLFSFCTRPDGPVYFPGAPFLLGAVFIVVSILLALKSLNAYHQQTK
ncbi:MAG TPA: tetracycline resistance MFS efflux pump, partial [Bacteroidia bacterium]|nr:tetracycline resistance MFS efflux pump [Bacteroidia bacterium]